MIEVLEQEVVEEVEIGGVVSLEDERKEKQWEWVEE